MTFTELKEKINIVKIEYFTQIRDLRKKYAIEHNPIKVGDIITDHYHTIKVESMSACVESHYYDYNTFVPFMRYKGVELTKQGIPKKRQQDNTICQTNVRIINNKPYEFANS